MIIHFLFSSSISSKWRRRVYKKLFEKLSSNPFIRHYGRLKSSFPEHEFSFKNVFFFQNRLVLSYYCLWSSASLFSKNGDPWRRLNIDIVIRMCKDFPHRIEGYSLLMSSIMHDSEYKKVVVY